ncbi:MAG: response regulator [Verrucomicrobia bacterium]|nr:response regulator [Verrucomicrobiota bacterium]
MNMTSDYPKCAILYVDDEVKSLRNFERAFGSSFRILTAESAQEGLRVLLEHRDEIGILMTDERMPGERGVWLLEKARSVEPRILRILVTAYADMDVAISAVNDGSIYKYVTKPWDPPMLHTLLRRALDFYLVQRERDKLLGEKLAMLNNMMVADRVVSLGLLAAGMSHHIRNALVAVKTFLELTPLKLKEEGVDVEGSRHLDFWGHYWRNALAQIDKINDMLKDLWAAAERPTSEFADQVSLGEVLRSVLDRMEVKLREQEVTVELRVPGELPAMHVDRKKFERLFELLFEDELVFLPAGSRIAVSAEVQEGKAGEPEIRIEVRDNGPGLPPESLRTIFDPFSVRNNSPSEYGIRLMACFFIVHFHRGNIVAQSAEGRGTTFTLRLPVNPRGLPAGEESDLFLHKVQLNDEMWSKLLASS